MELKPNHEEASTFVRLICRPRKGLPHLATAISNAMQFQQLRAHGDFTITCMMICNCLQQLDLYAE